MRHVLALDATGLKALEDLLKKMKKDKAVLILSGIHAQPFVVMDQAGFLEKIGKDNVQADIDTALERAREILGHPHA
jgi:SulP family sulfate permease